MANGRSVPSAPLVRNGGTGDGFAGVVAATLSSAEEVGLGSILLRRQAPTAGTTYHEFTFFKVLQGVTKSVVVYA